MVLSLSTAYPGTFIKITELQYKKEYQHRFFYCYYDRGSRPEVFCKKDVLEISQNLQKNTCARVFFSIKSLTQVFSCEFCKISKNTFFIEHL